MKAQTAKGIAISVLIAAALPILLVAQDQTTPALPQTRYVVRALSMLGGTQGGANGVPNNGPVTGWSNLSGDQAEHAVLWRGQTTIDIGTLGGPNSASSFPIKNDKGGSLETPRHPKRIRLTRTSARLVPTRRICAAVFVGRMAR